MTLDVLTADQIAGELRRHARVTWLVHAISRRSAEMVLAALDVSVSSVRDDLTSAAEAWRGACAAARAQRTRVVLVRWPGELMTFGSLDDEFAREVILHDPGALPRLLEFPSPALARQFYRFDAPGAPELDQPTRDDVREIARALAVALATSLRVAARGAAHRVRLDEDRDVPEILLATWLLCVDTWRDFADLPPGTELPGLESLRHYQLLHLLRKPTLTALLIEASTRGLDHQVPFSVGSVSNVDGMAKHALAWFGAAAAWLDEACGPHWNECKRVLATDETASGVRVRLIAAFAPLIASWRDQAVARAGEDGDDAGFRTRWLALGEQLDQEQRRWVAGLRTGSKPSLSSTWTRARFLERRGVPADALQRWLRP